MPRMRQHQAARGFYALVAPDSSIRAVKVPGSILLRRRGKEWPPQRGASVKVYILQGAASCYVFPDLLETNDFYLVPLKDGIGFDIFAKAAFSLTVEEALPFGSVKCGFEKEGAEL